MKIILSLITAGLLSGTSLARDFYVIDQDTGRTTYYQPRGQYIYKTDFGAERAAESRRQLNEEIRRQTQEIRARNSDW